MSTHLVTGGDNAYDNEKILEDNSLMAQAAANLRIRDLTGFSMESYREAEATLHNAGRGTLANLRFTYPGAGSRPPPQLPERRILLVDDNDDDDGTNNRNAHGSSNGDGGTFSNSDDVHEPTGNTTTTNNVASSNCPKEPQLPPRRANRRFMETPRPPKVAELCEGVIVIDGHDDPFLPRNTTFDRSQQQPPQQLQVHHELQDDGNSNGERDTDNYHHVVPCLSCAAKLRVTILASLVSCPKCNTVNPAVGD